MRVVYFFPAMMALTAASIMPSARHLVRSEQPVTSTTDHTASFGPSRTASSESESLKQVKDNEAVV